VRDSSLFSASLVDRSITCRKLRLRGKPMAIRNDLRAKLKASDRRRRRRVANHPQESQQQSRTQQVDVTGLIVDALIGIARRDRGFVDIGAVVALRSCLTGNVPAGAQAQAAYTKIQTIAARDDVSSRAYHVAIKELLEIASKHQKLDDSASFLNYLAIFSS